MKSIVIIAAMIAATSPVFAPSLMSCEIVDMGGYWNKVDPTCVYTADQSDHGDPLPDEDDLPEQE